MIGIAVNKAALDKLTGETAQAINEALKDARDIQIYLLATSQADLNGMGYTDQEVTVLKSAYTDLDKLHQIFVGVINLPAAQDFRAFAKQLWGVGVKSD
jgi:hypothetical protein